MDYSFLIGLHFRDDNSVDELKSPRNQLCSGNSAFLPSSSVSLSCEFIRSTRVKEICVIVDFSAKRDMKNDDMQDMRWIPIGRYVIFSLSSNLIVLDVSTYDE